MNSAATDIVQASDEVVSSLTGARPFDWQGRLLREWFLEGRIPQSIDVPTGLGKTRVMALWLAARAMGARLPRRLVYIVDRRSVVDQATEEAVKLRQALEGDAKHLKAPLGLSARKLPISTLRGAQVDNREWLDDPAAPAIIVGTVDMIGSRLLFEGYGVTRKMRPYQSGLLGVDSLIVLDEAHLVPPFAHLLRAIEQDEAFRPRDKSDREFLPPFVFLPLSATLRDAEERPGHRQPFRLQESDQADPLVAKRLNARKSLRLERLAQDSPDTQLAEAALALAITDGAPRRVVVFCDRRDKTDGGGASAQGVRDEIAKLAEGDKRAGRAKFPVHPPELLVGGRRVHERDGVAKRLRELGFIGDKTSLEKPAFLIATSAGEVGIDIDADHMASDLVAWERMAQRFGRVNRRGDGDATVVVFYGGPPTIKDAKAPTAAEKRALVAFAAKTVIESLPKVDGDFDAGIGALSRLAERRRSDAAIEALVSAATTREPLRPALNRALVDAWSMTSLETHTGRPNVAPWLRGWSDDVLQTTIVWRKHLPIRIDPSGGRTILPGKVDVEAFFEAAPPHESEKLETEVHRVESWLQARGKALLTSKTTSLDDGAEKRADDPEEPTDITADESIKQAAPPKRELGPEDIIVLMLSQSGDYEGHITLRELAEERKGDAKEFFKNRLVGKILVLDVALGGLTDGMLDPTCDQLPETADVCSEWSEAAQFRVRLGSSNGEPLPDEQNDGWRFEDDFILRLNAEGYASEKLVVEHFKDAAQAEDARSISNPQELTEHQEWARCAVLRIAQGVGLSGVAADALAAAAALHDEGKKSGRWQRAFQAPRDQKKYGLCGPLAKTRGPIDQRSLCGYRHEFGSLTYVEAANEFKALPDDWRDLVLHMVAAHHGRARPVIETYGCEDGPPSMLAEKASAVALRFARLQRRWGPWGLAWWEALVRAADSQASRENDQRRRPAVRPAP